MTVAELALAPLGQTPMPLVASPQPCQRHGEVPDEACTPQLALSGPNLLGLSVWCSPGFSPRTRGLDSTGLALLSQRVVIGGHLGRVSGVSSSELLSFGERN